MNERDLEVVTDCIINGLHIELSVSVGAKSNEN